jgi:hypothetical protein
MTRLLEGWTVHPPVHRLVAGYLGYKVPDKTPAKPKTPEEQNAQTEAFLSMFGGHMLIETAAVQALEKLKQDGREPSHPGPDSVGV